MGTAYSLSKAALNAVTRQLASALGPKGIRVNDLLYTMRLGEVRTRPISELSPGQYAACELLGPLTSDASLLIIDGQLDMLDPWTLHSVLELMRRLKLSPGPLVGELLELIAEGWTNQEIADKLFLNCTTVDSHRKNMLTKFNAKNTAALVKIAVSNHLI